MVIGTQRGLWRHIGGGAHGHRDIHGHKGMQGQKRGIHVHKGIMISW